MCIYRVRVHICIPLITFLFHIRTGPLIGTCCMRMEAKNSYFKGTAHNSNFKNVPYTGHQRLLCAFLNGGNFFDRTVECGPGTVHILSVRYIYVIDLFPIRFYNV